MEEFNSEYYFICYKSDAARIVLTPDEDTEMLPFTSERLPIGERPLKFYNGAFERQRLKGINPCKTPPEILFYGCDLVVSDVIYKKIVELEIPDLELQTSIYIDHNGQWYENYWFMTFTKLLDCWDRNKSIFDPAPLTGFGVNRFEVINYSLNDALLKEISLHKRRLFKIGGTTEGWVVAHKSIVKAFSETGATLVPIVDFGVRFFP